MNRLDRAVRSRCGNPARAIVFGIALLESIVVGGKCSLAAQNAVATVDSGVFGVVPHYPEDLALIESEVSSAKSELANTSNACVVWQLNNYVEWKQNTVDDMRDRCVQAFDPAGELPLAYSSRGEGTSQACSDPVRFPRSFTRLIANTRCGDKGVFRLPLPPGRYAIFVGWWAVGHTQSANPWWRFVDVKSHEWKEMIPPTGYGLHVPCTEDSNCANGLVCRAQFGGTSKGCESRPPSFPPDYNSGVSGNVGVAIPREYQCVEAFPESSNLMKACAVCAGSSPEFKLPLAPGRYRLEFHDFWTGKQEQTATVEVTPHDWNHLEMRVQDRLPPSTPCTTKGSWVMAP